MLYAVEIEPEVRVWLESLPAKHFLKIDEYVGLLAEHASDLAEPYARHLGDGVRELRPARRSTARRTTSSSHHREGRDRTMSHSRWKTMRDRKLADGAVEPDDVAEARREIRLSMALARAVYERRTELGLTQSDLADRAGLTQAKISRIEGSDTVPTLPLLSRLASALDASLNIALDDDDVRVTFTAHTADAA